MKRIFILLSLSFLSAGRPTPPYPDLNNYAVENMGSVYFGYSCSSWETLFQGCGIDERKVRTEVPPWIIAGGWRSYFMTDGLSSAVCSSPADLISNNGVNIRNNGVGPYNVTVNYLDQVGNCAAPSSHTWNRSYDGVYSAQAFNHPTAGMVSLGFEHTENKDRCNGSSNCYSTMISVADINECPYNGDYWPHYSAFICASWIPNTQATNWGQQFFSNEMGPIAWPSTGYLQANGVTATTGLGTPSSIQYNGYVYVFYSDHGPYGGLNPSDVEGRHEGIKVIRAPLSNALNPYAFQAYYRDPSGNEFWNPSLPAGFTKENMRDFRTVQGPMTTDLMGDEGANQFQVLRFSVAQVRNRDYFIGVESYIDINDGGKYKVALRFSQDLLHWTDRMRIIDVAADFNASTMNYPIFLSADGWSNTSIDEDNFYVLGTSPGNAVNNVVYRKHIYIPQPPVVNPPPPPPPPCDPTVGPPYEQCPTLVESASAMAAGTAKLLDEGMGKAPSVYPNPGHGIYQLRYTLKDHAVTQLSVLDLTGRRLQAGPSVLRAPGRVTETVNISAQAKGVYLLELLVNGGKKTFKVVYE